MTHSASSKSFNLAAGLLLILLSLILIIGTGELLLRLSGPDYEKKMDKNWIDMYFTYNSWGHRDYERTLEKPEDTFRILVLGDSMTVGEGIENVEDTYPKRLESYLNQNLPRPRFEIINAARPGWNTDTELYDLYINGFSFQPDMVFLAYYHNDIPRPEFFNCDAADLELVSGNSPLENFIKQFRLYGFINFRFNRLLETLERKPTFTDCINAAYSSIGWEMEKVYLDAIRMACLIRNVKLMIGVIPLVYQLGDGYPIPLVHQKIINYCKKTGVECIDFYEKGFKGLDANRLIVSESDRHLNAKGAEVVASALFKILEPLGQYKHLPKIHRAFTLRELLSGDETAKKTDRSFDQIKEGRPPFIISQAPSSSNKNNSEFKIWKESGNYFFLKTAFDSRGEKKVFTSLYTLDENGEFINNTFTTFDLALDNIKAVDFLESRDERFILAKTFYRSDGKKEEQKFIYRYYGKKKLNEGWSLRMEEGIHFHDPKTVVRLALLTNSHRKSAKQEVLFYDVLIFYYRYGWGDFADALIELIVKRNPAPIYLRAIAKIYKKTKNFSKLDELLRAHPELTQVFPAEKMG